MALHGCSRQSRGHSGRSSSSVSASSVKAAARAVLESQMAAPAATPQARLSADKRETSLRRAHGHIGVESAILSRRGVDHIMANGSRLGCGDAGGGKEKATTTATDLEVVTAAAGLSSSTQAVGSSGTCFVVSSIAFASTGVKLLAGSLHSFKLKPLSAQKCSSSAQKCSFSAQKCTEHEVAKTLPRQERLDCRVCVQSARLSKSTALRSPRSLPPSIVPTSAKPSTTYEVTIHSCITTACAASEAAPCATTARHVIAAAGAADAAADTGPDDAGYAPA
eukprot:6179117-Pleurochrysis_carterae.AAC.1